MGHAGNGRPAEHERATGSTRFESLVAFASQHGVDLPDPRPVDPGGYFEGSTEDITGLIGVIEIGCGHMIAVATQPTGVDRLFSINAEGGVWETDRPFAEHYDRWLDGLVASYVDLVAGTSGGTDMDGLRAAETIAQWKEVDRLASVRGIDRPQLLSGNEINAWTAKMLDQFETLPPLVLPPVPEA